MDKGVGYEIEKTTTEKPSALWPALLRAQQAIKPIAKSADNPFFHSKYAPLETVLAAVLPALNAEGLVVQQPVEIGEAGWNVVTRITHTETGEVFVIYRAEADSRTPWARPWSDFTAIVGYDTDNPVQRFERIDDE